MTTDAEIAERCCIPADGEEHCDHHPEWHDERRCNHPACRVTPPASSTSEADHA